MEIIKLDKQYIPGIVQKLGIKRVVASKGIGGD